MISGGVTSINEGMLISVIVVDISDNVEKVGKSWRVGDLVRTGRREGVMERVFDSLRGGARIETVVNSAVNRSRKMDLTPRAREFSSDQYQCSRRTIALDPQYSNSSAIDPRVRLSAAVDLEHRLIHHRPNKDLDVSTN